MYVKATLNDDSLYIDAETLEEAQSHFKTVMTTKNEKVDYDAIEWEVLEELPEGQIPLTFESVSKSGEPETTKTDYI
jgi:hypothetical protein